MSAVVQAAGLTRRFREVTAVDQVDLALEAGRIHGLLGRNGAGKTTLMQLLTGQDVPTSGQARLFGEDPYENPDVLARTCFVAEGQAYPDAYRVCHVLAAARLLHPGWDDAFADQLLAEYELPLGRRVRKLSRGMRSALGVVVGLASRAELTFFDEPYLGLDAVARQTFYDRLLADFAEHPRTVVLSTHLIDEVAELLEHVVVVDHGRVLVDEDADELRAGAIVVSGPAAVVKDVVNGRRVLHCEQLAGLARVTVRTRAADDVRAQARRAGLTVEPLSLQQLVVRTTQAGGCPQPAGSELTGPPTAKPTTQPTTQQTNQLVDQPSTEVLR
ncbi:ABC transporter ATP-binding protein [Angustibacter sp. McL0619]|uniref:ABC transporter ATP-binding protein n=1 Tax=Angustibacter sp. McL0619 TaxID=3415676 RepID=UPI003CF4292A